MLKKRIIPVLLLRDGRMVKGKQFMNFRDTGEPKTAVRIYSAQDADELVLLDINSSPVSRESLVQTLTLASEECFMPLAAGGGINSLEDIRELLLAGADKVVINTSTVTNPELIVKASRYFGNQCIVAGIDYRTISGVSNVWIRNGREKTKFTPIEHAQKLAAMGVGEILLNCIDRDGMMQGYDLEFSETLASSTNVPVIICGGAGNFMHLAEALQCDNISAAACSSLFHFGDNNPIRARSYLRNLGLPMRNLR
jgi:cyclase